MLAGIAGAIALIPGAGGTVGAITTALGYLLRCALCLKILAIAALVGWTALHVHHADGVRCEAEISTRLEEQRQAAAAAAVVRDAGIKADLEKSLGPGLGALRALNKALQDKVDQYAKRKPVAASAGKAGNGCKLGDAAGLLHTPATRQPAGAAKGGIADYLRGHFGDN